MLQGPSCPAVQYVLPPHGGGTQRRALSWTFLTPRSLTGLLLWPVRGPSFSRTSPPQPGHTSAGEYRCAQAPGRGMTGSLLPLPELTGKPGLCASSVQPLVPSAVPEHLLGAALSQHWEHTALALGLGATSGLP